MCAGGHRALAQVQRVPSLRRVLYVATMETDSHKGIRVVLHFGAHLAARFNSADPCK